MWFRDTVQTSLLPNGLTVISDYYPRDTNDPYRDTLAIRIICNTGSNDDPIDQNGRAHFAEHMIAHASGRFSTPQEFEKFCDSLCLQSYNLKTGTERTKYLAHGRADRVRGYLELIGESINGLHYGSPALEYERARIVNEMEDALTTFGQIRTHTIMSSAFAQQSAGKWNGGYPRHLECMSITDMTAHHRDLHTGQNMTLITSGAWTHEQACTWAQEHLGNLPEGQKKTRPKKIFVAGQSYIHHPYMYHPEANYMVDYFIAYDSSFLDPRASEALRFGCYIINQKISETSDFYGIDISSSELNGHPIIRITGSKLREGNVHPTLTRVVENIRSTVNKLSLEDFESSKSQYTTPREEAWAQSGYNPYNRIGFIESGYVTNDNPQHLDFIRQTIPTLQQDEVQDALRSVFRRVPLTLYTAARKGNFPTGQELQNTWFGRLNPAHSPAASSTPTL